MKDGGLPELPTDVLEWLIGVFAAVNRGVSGKLTRIPTIHETNLDMTVVEQLSQFSSPFRFESGWTVKIDTHYLGGGRHFGSWEIADLGVLVVFRRAGSVVKTKAALLQSKRLYPVESMSESEDVPLDYVVGFGRLLQSDSEFRAAVRSREFNFERGSSYRAFEYEGDQYKRVLAYQNQTKIPVYYCLYHPLQIPTMRTLPVEVGETDTAESPCEVGCRVLGARRVGELLADSKPGTNPRYADFEGEWAPDLMSGPTRLERFVVDRVIGCHEGYVVRGDRPSEDEGLFRMFSRRSGPISAALSIAIDAPA